MRLHLPLRPFNRHVPRRDRAKWDGLNFVSSCRFCKASIRRLEQGRWKRDWLESRKVD
jgi:hypothetical protein